MPLTFGASYKAKTHKEYKWIGFKFKKREPVKIKELETELKKEKSKNEP